MWTVHVAGMPADRLPVQTPFEQWPGPGVSEGASKTHGWTVVHKESGLL